MSKDTFQMINRRNKKFASSDRLGGDYLTKPECFDKQKPTYNTIIKA